MSLKTLESADTAATLAEPLWTLLAAQQRLRGRRIEAQHGRLHRTVLLLVPRLALALVQPNRKSSEAAEWATHRAKADLDAELQAMGAASQGVVYLPRYANVAHSAAGAADLSKRRLTYEVESGSGDLLTNAADWLDRWVRQVAAGREHAARFGETLRRFAQGTESDKPDQRRPA
jgi:hypothetical protein